MKKIITFACLALGFLATSCQNDIDEVINVNDVISDVATTRTYIEEPADNVQYVSLDAASSVTFTGPSIMV